MLHFPLFFFQLNGSRILYKNILYFCCGPIFLFLPCSVFLFSSQQCVSRIWRLTFSHKWLKSCWIPRSPSLGPPSGCRGEGIGGRRSPSCWWEGAFAGCMRLYWKRNLCCSNSFFCCSLDCQDVLNISVLWAWSFNKKNYLCNHLACFVFLFLSFFYEQCENWSTELVIERRRRRGGVGGNSRLWAPLCLCHFQQCTITVRLWNHGPSASSQNLFTTLGFGINVASVHRHSSVHFQFILQIS